MKNALPVGGSASMQTKGGGTHRLIQFIKVCQGLPRARAEVYGAIDDMLGILIKSVCHAVGTGIGPFIHNGTADKAELV